MMLGSEVFVFLKDSIELPKNSSIRLMDFAQVWSNQYSISEINEIEFGNLSDKKYYLYTSLDVFMKLKEGLPECEIRMMGSSQVSISEHVSSSVPKGFVQYMKVFFVCLLLFIGGGLAIMNFHADVDMPKVHRNIYRLITGEVKKYPLEINIPYSIGIGLGIAIFFNQIPDAKKRKDPSPLELELFSYQNSLDEYKRAKCGEEEKREQNI